MTLVYYRQQFAWTCPDCGLVNYLWHRPRRRRAVACGADDAQLAHRGGCGVVHEIAGLDPTQ
ncbi:MAG: hypothetical protein QM621_14900 [Aeromicrobium sp.]|uniref:hypothetical protein n=1 Tax=Aeromicrobium sp. TaxID=1871063 RepID=UPI0039E684D9